MKSSDLDERVLALVDALENGGRAIEDAAPAYQRKAP